MLFQTILQSLFIIDAWWRRSSNSEQRRKKPGRQLVTFLLVANMAMWAINTLEKVSLLTLSLFVLSESL